MDYFEFEKKKPRANGGAEDNKENEQREKEKKDEKKGLEELNKRNDLEDKIGQDIQSKEEKVNIERSIRNRIEYDMSQIKKTLKMKKEDKVEMELMRRWRVKIFNIYITALKEKLDPFLQFTIGGDFKLQVIVDKKGQTIKRPTGKRGFSQKTEVIYNIDVSDKRAFDRVIETEMRMSYSMIESQKLMVELWDYDSFWTNKIKGYCTDNLIEIVNGNINLSMTILQRNKDGKNPIPYAIIEYKCLFQEIFDFKLTFINWKMSCVVPPEKKKELENSDDPNIKKPDLQIEIRLENHKFLQSNVSVKSEICQNSDTPNWSDFTGCIIYRGCIDDLESQNLIINLYKHSFLFKSCISSKYANLKGILNLERIKTQMTIVEEKDNSKFYPSIEGGVIIEPSGQLIKYKQIGDNVTLLTTKKYLCIKIMRVENIKPPEAMGLVDSFITAEWCGFTQRTRTVKENNNPNFNEVLYFPAPFPPEYIRQPELYIQKINEELATKNEVIFNLMIEGDNNTYDNLGIGFFHLSELKNGEKNNYKYFAVDKKKDVNYVSRLFTGKAKLISAFSTSKLTFVNYEAWFLEDFPDLVDYGEKKDKDSKLDKIPVELDHLWNHKKKKNDFVAHYKRVVTKDFSKQSSYSFKERLFFELTKKDQYEDVHFLPYFLSVISVPEKKFSKEEIEKNRNFFDCNIRTLDEAAHYVRCFPFNAEKGDVTVTPDFLLKTRKGDLDDHAIFMACLMMGLKKDGYNKKNKLNKNNNRNNLDYEDFGTTANGGTTTKNPNANNTTTDGFTSLEAQKEKDVFPYENRVFVCLGKMKNLGTAHTWIMTIDDNYKDITFWDPRVNAKFTLKGRVENPVFLRRFLNREAKNRKDLKSDEPPAKLLEESMDEDDELIKKKKLNDIFDDRRPNGENEDDFNNYSMRNDSYNDFGHDLDMIVKDIDMVNNPDEVIKLKKKKFDNMIDEKIINKRVENEADEKNGYNFIQENNKQIDNEMDGEFDKYFLPVDKFIDLDGNEVKPVNLPYETIDIIFNRNNVFANYQYFDPTAIYYDIFNERRWRPVIDLNIGPNPPTDEAKQKLWTGLFESFYPLCNFGPPLSPNLVNKMREALIKEVRVGITISRSSNNLQTKFKKKNEQINTILGQYCEYMENRALNRISESQFNKNLLSWKEQIKTKIPKYFKMDARCMHFNFYDLERIRKNIDEDLKPFYNRKEKNCVFATSAKIFPYPNQIVSVRIITAVFVKIPEYEVPTTELEDYRITLKEDKDKLIEEENSDEEEPIPEEAKNNDNDRTVSPDQINVEVGKNNNNSNKNENQTRKPDNTATPVDIELKKK